jgi:hypothetical protein
MLKIKNKLTYINSESMQISQVIGKKIRQILGD